MLLSFLRSHGNLRVITRLHDEQTLGRLSLARPARNPPVCVNALSGRATAICLRSVTISEWSLDLKPCPPGALGLCRQEENLLYVESPATCDFGLGKSSQVTARIVVGSGVVPGWVIWYGARRVQLRKTELRYFVVTAPEVYHISTNFHHTEENNVENTCTT